MRRFILLVSLLAAPAAARAVFGVGDVVYDPANTTQTINVLRQAQQEFDRLGTLLGVSTRQFDQLVRLSTAVGGPGSTALAATTPGQLLAAVQAVPGLETADLGALFDTNGLLDAFLGTPLSQWTLAIENPRAYLRTILVNPAISRVGASSGLSTPAIAYAQWYAARSPEDRLNSGTASAVDFSNLLASDWLQGSKTRRVNLEGLAAGNQGAGAGAQSAATVLDGQRAQAQLSANTNAILLEAAAQAADASENAVGASQAQTRLLQDERDGLRDADELRLDAP
jgi:hypothetical protein